MRPIHTFTVVPCLPPRVERLRELAYNLWWSWHMDVIDLFRNLDRDLWERSGHNPVLMLGTAMLVTELSRGLARYMHESHDQALHLEPLLICVAAGFTVRNYSPAGERFAASLDIVHLPVFVLFFALAGAGLDLQALRLTWAAAAVLVLVRLVAIFAGAYLGGRCAGSPATANRVAGLAYLTQAGVSLGLAAEVVRRFPEWGETFATVVVAVITVNQVIGPIAMRAVLVRVGEARSAVVDAAAPEPGSAE